MIDTKAIFTASTEADYLTIQESASGAASLVQDIEVINATVLADDGYAPTVLELFTNSENMFSLSIDLSKLMDHESVEDTLNLTSSEDMGSEGEDGVIPFMALWIGRTLHMVPDLQTQKRAFCCGSRDDLLVLLIFEYANVSAKPLSIVRPTYTPAFIANILDGSVG